MSEFTINTRLYSWADIKAFMLGRMPTGITEITYKDNLPHEDVYGQGNVPVGYTVGNYKAEASITLLMGEVEALRRASPTGRLSSIRPFLITVAYINEDQIPVKHSFTAKFTSDEGGGNNGNSNALATTLPLKVVGMINWKA